jgi:hypothetical protein
MTFQKYMHLERFGTDEVDGINLGECHIFPKLDGTNASVWQVGGFMHCGSRNRELALDDDNAGFMNWAVQQQNLKDFLKAFPDYRLYGEWLVPHSLKTYRDDAWRQFYVFDVVGPDDMPLHYDDYSKILKQFNIEFIPCVLKVVNPDYDTLSHETEKNRFLLKENSGIGEGIVVKQYGWKNRFGRTVWAKLITNTFKDKHILEMGGNSVVNKMLEEELAQEFVTLHTVDKALEKIRLEEGSFGSKQIPRLLNTVYHELIVEEMWEIVKKYKNPKIDFKTLNSFCIKRVKSLKPEIFGG